MSKKVKQMLVLLALLAAAIIALLVVKLVNYISEKNEAAETEAATTYVDLPTDPDTISWQTSDGSLTLTKDSDGNWGWSEDSDFPLSTSLVESLTSALSDLSTQTAFSPEDSLSAYGLDEPTYTVTVSNGSDSKTLLFGSSFNDNGESDYYAKLSDSDTIYVLDSTVPGSLVSSIYDLADCAPISATDATSIDTVTISGTAETVLTQQATEDEDGNTSSTWTMDGTDVTDETTMTNLTAELKNPSFSSMVDWKPDDATLATYGLTAPAAQVTVTTTDSGGYTLTIGTANDDATAYYATPDGGKSIYLISSSKVNDLLDVAANGFTVDTDTETEE